MEVLNVFITGRLFIVTTGDGTVEFKRTVFENWADDEVKREWISVRPDHTGEPVEDSGTLTWGEYFNDRGAFYKDVGEFIDKHKIKPVNNAH